MSSTPEPWELVDEFLDRSLLGPDPVLDAVLKASAAAGLPSIQVSPCQGRLLQILAQQLAARSILELGTLGGYSTIWLARGLSPGGRLITLEVNPDYARVASANFTRARLTASIEIRVGPALESLATLARESLPPFDLIFIDADKQGTPDYFRWALELSRPGSLIIVDNVIRKGALIEEQSNDPAVQGMRRFIQMVGAEPRVMGTAIQTVGVKGYDGFAVVRVNNIGKEAG